MVRWSAGACTTCGVAWRAGGCCQGRPSRTASRTCTATSASSSGRPSTSSPLSRRTSPTPSRPTPTRPTKSCRASFRCGPRPPEQPACLFASVRAHCISSRRCWRCSRQRAAGRAAAAHEAQHDRRRAHPGPAQMRADAAARRLLARGARAVRAHQGGEQERHGRSRRRRRVRPCTRRPCPPPPHPRTSAARDEAACARAGSRTSTRWRSSCACGRRAATPRSCAAAAGARARRVRRSWRRRARCRTRARRRCLRRWRGRRRTPSAPRAATLRMTPSPRSAGTCCAGAARAQDGAGTCLQTFSRHDVIRLCALRCARWQCAAVRAGAAQ